MRVAPALRALAFAICSLILALAPFELVGGALHTEGGQESLRRNLNA